MKREDNFQKYATDVYDPIKIGSIDGMYGTLIIIVKKSL